MTIQLLIFVLALVAIIFFFKNFNACVYFIVMVDIFLRIVTYLTAHYFRADAFSFLDSIPESVLAILNSFEFFQDFLYLSHYTTILCLKH